jgi:hypothetical protein
MNTKLLILLTVVLSIVILLYYSYTLLNTNTKEGFASESLQVRFCPSSAPVIQTSTGYTDCCEGELLDGKCKGEVVCTQSPSHDSIPTCPDYWKDYFKKKAASLCPPSLPNYYESVTNPKGEKGCSASSPVADGTGPSDTRAPKCRVYETADENKSKMDSCHIEKMREKVRCPVLSDAMTTEVKVASNGTSYAYLYCFYTSNTGIPSFCGDDKSYITYLDKVMPNWKTSSYWGPQLQESMCSNFLDARNTNSREAQKKRLDDERRRREQAEKALKDAQDQNAKLQTQWQAAVNDAKNCKR